PVCCLLERTQCMSASVGGCCSPGSETSRRGRSLGSARDFGCYFKRPCLWCDYRQDFLLGSEGGELCRRLGRTNSSLRLFYPAGEGRDGLLCDAVARFAATCCSDARDLSDSPQRWTSLGRCDGGRIRF